MGLNPSKKLYPHCLLLVDSRFQVQYCQNQKCLFNFANKNVFTTEGELYVSKGGLIRVANLQLDMLWDADWHVFFLCPPFEEEITYCFAHVSRSVRLYPFHFWSITRERLELPSSNLSLVADEQQFHLAAKHKMPFG